MCTHLTCFFLSGIGYNSMVWCPKNLWSEISTEVVKVIIKGTGAETLPNEILQRELKNRSIILVTIVLTFQLLNQKGNGMFMQ